MSERKRGGFDYTPRAFPGARDPDGPAPDLESKLAKLGLLEGSDSLEVRASNVRADASEETKPAAKKRSGLDYTARAFPGARDPDGPAPDLAERLAKLGLLDLPASTGAQPGARPDARPDIRPGASEAPPPVRKERPVSTPSLEDAPRSRMREPTPAAAREPPGASIPQPPRVERNAPVSSPHPPPAAPTSQPMYAAPAPGLPLVDEPPTSQPDQLFSARRLPRVPPEPVPRPAPVTSESPTVELSQEIPAKAGRSAPPAARAGRGPVRIRRLADKEERTRLSLRLAQAVDQKLEELAHLRGLDRNTAVSVAIVQDWVACFGLQARQAGR